MKWIAQLNWRLPGAGKPVAGVIAVGDLDRGGAGVAGVVGGAGTRHD
jgi:hypothetical protein